MRVEYWDTEGAYRDFSNVSKERVLKAAHVIKRAVARHLRSQIGKGKTTGINRPVYLTGKYAGENWTAREAGRMLKSIRVVQDKEHFGREVFGIGTTRIYAGDYLAFYADIFEFYRPFMRPAVEEVLGQVKEIMGV